MVPRGGRQVNQLNDLSKSGTINLPARSLYAFWRDCPTPRAPPSPRCGPRTRDVLVLAVLSTNFDVGDFIGHPSVLTALLAGVDSGEIVLDVLSFDRDAVSLAKT